MLRSTFRASVAAACTLAQIATMTAFGQTYHTVQVRAGDTLYKISVAEHIPLSTLESANPNLRNFKNLQVGQRVKIPNRSALNTAATSAQRVRSLLRIARSFIGVPYVWGGTSPTSGFDCSGFVQYVYARAGIDLPRQSHQQATVGKSISKQNLKPGDLLFFANTDQYARLYANHVTHVGIYMGQGNMIESSSVNHHEGVVIVKRVFANSFYRSHYFGARRVLP